MLTLKPAGECPAGQCGCASGFALQMGMGMRWMINGRTFEMTDVARDGKVRLGDTEFWEFVN